MNDDICKLCGSEIRLMQINFDEAILICQNTKCIFPFNDFNAASNIIPRNFTTLALNKDQQNLEFNSSSSNDISTENWNPDDECFENILNFCHSVEMSQEDIEAVDDLFEALQNYQS